MRMKTRTLDLNSCGRQKQAARRSPTPSLFTRDRSRTSFVAMAASPDDVSGALRWMSMRRRFTSSEHLA